MVPGQWPRLCLLAISARQARIRSSQSNRPGNPGGLTGR